MKSEKRAVWLIRAGSKSEAESLLLKSKVLALGPAQVGDVSGLTEREAYKSQFRHAFPNASAISIGGSAGQLFRFANEAKANDVVVYPAKVDGTIHVGLVTGEYRYDQSKDEEFPHQRKVRWVGSINRTDMSGAFLKEARAFKSFYRISKCEQEVVALLEEFETKKSGKNS